MPHMEKVKQSGIHQVLGHDLRSKKTRFKSADPKLEEKNRYFVNTENGFMVVKGDNKELQEMALEYQKKRLSEVPHVNRKDLVSAVEWIVTCPKDLPEAEQDKFLDTAIAFMLDRYGDENAVCAGIHKDEPNAMPHVHFVFIPVDKKGKVCCKNVMNRKELSHYHPDLEKYESRILGHNVYILKEADERTITSLPLSQYKVSTKDREATQKLETAQNLLQNAQREAMKVAEGNLSKLNNQGLMGRFRDNRPLVAEAIEASATAEALAKAELERKSKELDQSRELLRRQGCFLEEKEMGLAVQNDDQDRREEELKAREARLQQEQREVEKRLAEVRRLSDQADMDKRKAENHRAYTEAKEKKLQEDRKQFDLEKVSFEALQKTWESVAKANESKDKYESYWRGERGVSAKLRKISDSLSKENKALQAKLDNSEKSYRDAIDRIKAREEQKFKDWMKDYNRELQEKNKLINDVKTKIIPVLKEQITSANDEKCKLADENERLRAEAKELKTTLVNQKEVLDCSISESKALSAILDNKPLDNLERATRFAYHEQLLNALEKTGIETDDYNRREPTRRIQEKKAELDRPKGIHHTNSRGRSR